jgi:hypothetical protein
MADNFFCFCSYDSHYPHYATFVNLDKVSPEIVKQVEQIIEVGRFIVVNNGGYVVDGNIQDKQVNLVINFWARLMHMDELPEENMYGYYINDENRGLSPLELYKKLTSFQEFRNIKMNIVECVMVSNIPFNEKKKPLCLRFFAAKKMDIELDKLKGLILENENIKNVLLASKDNTFSGYGYIYVDHEMENYFLDNGFMVNDIRMIVDMG